MGLLIILFLLAIVVEYGDISITLTSSFFWIMAIVWGVLIMVEKLIKRKERKLKVKVSSYVITSKEDLDKALDEIFGKDEEEE